MESTQKSANRRPSLVRQISLSTKEKIEEGIDYLRPPSPRKFSISRQNSSQNSSKIDEESYQTEARYQPQNMNSFKNPQRDLDI